LLTAIGLSPGGRSTDFLKDLEVKGRRDIQMDLRTIEWEVLTWIQLF